MEKEMSVLEAKAQLRDLMDFVHDSGETVTLTKNGVPHVQMKPLVQDLPASSKKLSTK
jgi:antitoxin (DNA-binding transcriptional repressor) of toxin-antitoxin stability system